ncbi:MAG: hypothetical protein ABR509_03820 [Candidatus Limnocylindria bacterium]
MTSVRAPMAIGVLGLIGLAAGLYLLAPSDIGFTPAGVARGIVGQLSTTLPATVLVLAACAVNLATGATLVRLVRRTPFESLGDAALAGLVGAVLFDTLLLMSLGSVGLFRWPVIGVLMVAIVVASYRFRPMVSVRPTRWPMPSAAPWLLVAVVWSVPLVLQLASPAVPFLDVLPNHVAPVEHLRTFGGFETLSTSPSPIYGPSRLFLGYVSLLGVVATLTGLPAATAVAAFALPLTLLVAIAAYRAAVALLGASAGYWALLTVPLSVVFLRLPDARGSVLVFVPLACACTLLFARRGVTEGRRAACLAGALGAALLIHPLVGGLAGTTIAGLTLALPSRFARVTVPGLVGAAFVGAPQAAIMVGLTVPPWAGLLAVPAAVLAGRAAHGVRVPLAPVRPVVAAVLVLVGLLYAPQLIPGAVGAIGDALELFPVLAIGAALAVSMGATRGRWSVVAVAIGTLALAGGITAALPREPLFAQSLRYEVPKTLAYWGSWFLALAAAAGLRDLWRGRGWPGRFGPVVAAAFIVAASLPLRAETPGLNDHREYRYAESAAVALHHAERGYWQGFPDARLIVDAQEAELVDVLRGEYRAGRLNGGTEILHVAESFQQWASTPLGVFGGFIETDATLDPEYSIHTTGGRLHHVDELPDLLWQGFGYVVVEPNGLPRDVRPEVEAAGYRSFFANARGEIFRRDG